MADANPNGRPTEMTPETITKLESIFAIGGTDKEACAYANIGTSTLYNYQQRNPNFVERKEQLKEKPFIKARLTIVRALEDPHHAQWFMERKRKAEFALRSEITGADGKNIVFMPAELLEKHGIKSNNSNAIPESDSKR